MILLIRRLCEYNNITGGSAITATHYSYTSPKLEKRSNPLKGGYGLFAIRPIEGGELLAVWGGEIHSGSELGVISNDPNTYGLQVEEDLYLWSVETLDDADFINHSCNPNAGLSGQICLIAMRPISIGEEICYDYAMSDGSDYDSFECMCGEPGCRRRVTGQDWRLADLQQRYAGYFSPYLQRRINRNKTGE